MSHFVGRHDRPKVTGGLFSLIQVTFLQSPLPPQDGGGMDGLGAIHAAARDGDASLVSYGVVSLLFIVYPSIRVAFAF